MYLLCQYDYVKRIVILVRYFACYYANVMTHAKDYVKRIATLICYFACYYANIVTQMSYKLVNPWFPWQYGKHLRRSISISGICRTTAETMD